MAGKSSLLSVLLAQDDDDDSDDARGGSFRTSSQQRSFARSGSESENSNVGSTPEDRSVQSETKAVAAAQTRRTDVPDQKERMAARRSRAKPRLRKFVIDKKLLDASAPRRVRSLGASVERPEPLLLSDSEEDDSGAHRKVSHAFKTKSLKSLVEYDVQEESEAELVSRQRHAEENRKRKKIDLLGEGDEFDAQEAVDTEGGFVSDQPSRSDSRRSFSFSQSAPARTSFHKKRIALWDARYPRVGTLMDPLVRLDSSDSNLDFTCLACGEGFKGRSLVLLLKHITRECALSKVAGPAEQDAVRDRGDQIKHVLESSKAFRALQARSRLQSKQEQAIRRTGRRFLLNRTVEFFLQSGISKTARNVRLVKDLLRTNLELRTGLGLNAAALDALKTSLLKDAVRRVEERSRN